MAERIRLHLGAGDRSWPRWINVDCVGDQDLISDVTKLDLPDDHADEISAIHLFEHIPTPKAKQTLLEWLRVLKPYDMTYCTGPNDQVECVPWSTAAQEQLLRQSNIVLLPSKGETYKSANRLINAVMAGCFVIGSKNDINKEFRHFCYLGPVRGGLQFSQAYKHELNGLVRDGQRYIQMNYSPEQIGAQWDTVFASI